MAKPVNPIDLATPVPLAQVVKRVTTSQQAQDITQDGRVIARIVPTTQTTKAHRRELVDTTAIPPVPHCTIAELQTIAKSRQFLPLSDEELTQAITDARVDAWQAKHQ